MVEDFLTNFSGESIPIQFIEHIYIIYIDDTEKHIGGDKIRELFPHITNTTYGVLKSHNDIKSLEIRIDKNRVLAYLREIDSELTAAITEAINSLLDD